MALERRGRIWHYDFIIDNVRYRGTTRQTTKAAAREVEDRERERIRTVGRTDRRNITLREVAAEWWNARSADLKSARTKAFRMRTLQGCINFDLSIHDISTRVVADAIAIRRGQITHNGRMPTPATVNRDIIETLRPILNYAETVMEVRGLPRINWAALRLREPKSRVREFTAVELSAIRAKIAHLPHHRDLFEFFSTFGTRLEEAWFPLDCLDADGGRIFLRERKGGDWHTLPLDDHWRRLLGARSGRAARAGINTVWFWEDGEGQLHALTSRAYQSYMKSVLIGLGIREARPAHDLRHHALTQYVRRTGSLKGAQRLAGHENIATTARYAHADEDDVRRGLFGDPAQNPPHKLSGGG